MDFDSDQESITPNQRPYIQINTTGALWIPAGTTAQRPGSPSAGFLRYNSDTPGLEYWNGSAWVAPSGGGGGASLSTTATASEALAAGDWVDVWNNAGTLNVRKADATLGYSANGFVTAAFAISATATVFFAGLNTGVTGMTTGSPVYLQNAGAGSHTIPATGKLVQKLGTAYSATSVMFQTEYVIQT